MATLVTVHEVDPTKLARVRAEMQELGAPTLRAVDVAGIYYLLEGTHRSSAAASLGLTVRLDLVEYDAEMQSSLRVSELCPGSDCDNECGEVIGNPRGSEIVECDVEILSGGP